MTEPVRINRGGSKKIAGVDYKWWLIGGAGTGLIVWWWWKKNSAPAAPTDSSQGIDTSAYGDVSTPQGAMAQLGAYYDPTTGTYIPIGGGQQQIVTAPSSNLAWMQAAVAYLVAQGYDGVTVTAALGKYLAGAGLTQAELAIVQAALGAEGNPPTPVPAPHVEPPTTVTPPTKKLPLATPQLRVLKKTPSGGTLGWTAVPNAAFYMVLGTNLPLNVGNATAKWMPHGIYHIRAYPLGYSQFGFPTGTETMLLSAASNSVRV